MTRSLPLVVPALGVESWDVQRGRFSWLGGDGWRVERGTPLGVIDMQVARSERGNRLDAFAGEREVRITLAAPRAGTLRHTQANSQSFYLDGLAQVDPHSAEVVGRFEVDAPNDAEERAVLLPFFQLGRRWVVAGSWHSRQRWWAFGDRPIADYQSVVVAGICELEELMTGGCALPRLAVHAARPMHLALHLDHLIVPTAAVLAEGISRSPGEATRIVEDIASWFSRHAGNVGDIRDVQEFTRDSAVVWCIAQSLVDPSPLVARLPIATHAGVEPLPLPNTVVLSVNSETAVVYRHKRLGYSIAFHLHRVLEFGGALTAWLRAEFEPVLRDPAQIELDLRRLFELASSHGVGNIIVLGSASDIDPTPASSYLPFPQPLREIVYPILAQECNHALERAARDHGVSILDVSAILTAEGAHHMPDRVHLAPVIRDAIRVELARMLDENSAK